MGPRSVELDLQNSGTISQKDGKNASILPVLARSSATTQPGAADPVTTVACGPRTEAVNGFVFKATRSAKGCNGLTAGCLAQAAELIVGASPAQPTSAGAKHELDMLHGR